MSEPVSTQLCAAWAVEADLPGFPNKLPALPDGVSWDELLVVASEILWALSGRQWSGDGGCEATARMVRDRDRCIGWSPVGWWNWPDPFLARPVVQHQRAMQLPHDEITDVVSVMVDDAAFSGYERRGSWLLRTDGGSWFTSAVEVTYTWGFPPPEGGKRAAAAYALELGKGAAGDSTCRLPKRVVSITRQGISMSLIDPQRYLDNGKLGMPDIDQWLAAVNPKAQAERGSVWSPDVPRAHVVP